jgi:hypothetical protein
MSWFKANLSLWSFVFNYPCYFSAGANLVHRILGGDKIEERGRRATKPGDL